MGGGSQAIAESAMTFGAAAFWQLNGRAQRRQDPCADRLSLRQVISWAHDRQTLTPNLPGARAFAGNHLPVPHLRVAANRACAGYPGARKVSGQEPCANQERYPAPGQVLGGLRYSVVIECRSGLDEGQYLEWTGRRAWYMNGGGKPRSME